MKIRGCRNVYCVSPFIIPINRYGFLEIPQLSYYTINQWENIQISDIIFKEARLKYYCAGIKL